MGCLPIKGHLTPCKSDAAKDVVTFFLGHIKLLLPRGEEQIGRRKETKDY